MNLYRVEAGFKVKGKTFWWSWGKNYSSIRRCLQALRDFRHTYKSMKFRPVHYYKEPFPIRNKVFTKSPSWYVSLSRWVEKQFIPC